MDIFIVEDSDFDALYLSDSLAAAGYEVSHFASLNQFLIHFDKMSNDVAGACLIVLDLFLPDAGGMDLIDRFRAKDIRAPIVLASNKERSYIEQIKVESIAKGLNVLAAMPKPVNVNQLIEIIKAQS